MTNPNSGISGDSSEKLFGEWNLADDPGSRPGEVDSLLAFTEGRGRARSGVPGSRRPGNSSPGQSAREADLYRAFSINDEPEDYEDDAALAGLRLGAGHGSSGQDPAAALPVEQPPLVLPRPGDRVGGFLMIGELGRGAFARVYLARQEELGNRLVALKVSRAEGDEPQILARLQHTHIVPIHSVHDDPLSGLRLMCMPYLGGANLAQVLEAAGGDVPSQATGRSLVEALDVVSHRLYSARGLPPSLLSVDSMRASPHAKTLTPAQAGTASARSPNWQSSTRSILEASSRSVGTIQSLWTRISGRSRTLVAEPAGVVELELEPEPDQPSRQFLREANSIQAAVWIVARLAEGLDHAHSRGLLHRDLKPSNVLIADDGTPMLLDFNLATINRIRGVEEGSKAMLGGTLPYMAPEHLDAFHPRGTTPSEAVAEQADLYALGLILFEMIAGEHPFPEPPPGLPLPEIIQLMIDQRQAVPSLRAACPEVPWSLDALVARCLDPVPARRYARARDMAEDLRRFLDNLPMKHTPERSMRERVVKWARRNPSVTSSTSVGLISLILILAAGGVISLLSSTLQGVSARLKYRAFLSDFSECQLLLNTTSGPVEHLGRGIKLADKARSDEGGSLWNVGREDSWTRWLSAVEQKRLREDLVELILLEARAKTFLARQRGSEADQRAALEWSVEWLDRAERIDPRPTAALYGDRARYLRALGLSALAEADRKREAQTQPSNSRDFALLGTSLLVKRDLPAAETALFRSVELDPRRFWARFALGFCHFEQGRYLEAAGDFDVCTALEPDFAWPYMNRGLALACAGRLEQARSSYDLALQKNPKFTEALVNRALARLELDDLEGAEGDLRRAIDLRRSEPNVMAALGEVLARRGRRAEAEALYARLLGNDPENASYRIARAVLRLRADPQGARDDLTRVLKREPRNARALYVLARVLARDDPSKALGYVDAALSADPNLGDALQYRALLRARLGNLAAIDDVERLVQAPTAIRLYNAACALAILSETTADRRLGDRSLALLGRSFDAGFPAAKAAADPDLKPLADRRELHELLLKAASSPRPKP